LSAIAQAISDTHGDAAFVTGLQEGVETAVDFGAKAHVNCFEKDDEDEYDGDYEKLLNLDAESKEV
jgi:hypothetical protein